MDFDMKHMSAEEAYGDLSNEVEDYFEFEKLVYRVNHTLSNQSKIKGTTTLENRRYARKLFKEAMDDMLDNSVMGNHPHIQGTDDTVHCANALQKLKQCRKILKDLEDGDWGDYNGLRDELFSKNPHPLEAINRIIRVCNEVSEKSLNN